MSLSILHSAAFKIIQVFNVSTKPVSTAQTTGKVLTAERKKLKDQKDYSGMQREELGALMQISNYSGRFASLWLL
jgi:hypothetical protein